MATNPIDPNALVGLGAKSNPNQPGSDNTNTVMLLALVVIVLVTVIGNVCIAIFKEGDVLGLISAVSAIGVLVATAIITLLKQGQELHKTVNSRMGEMIDYVQRLSTANATLAANKEAEQKARELAVITAQKETALAMITAEALKQAQAAYPPGVAPEAKPAPEVQQVTIVDEVVAVKITGDERTSGTETK